MVILTQDPSFKKLSFSLFDGNRTVYIDSCEFKFGEIVGFEEVFNANHNVWEQYKEKLESLGVGKELIVDKVFSEIPPPVGMFSAGLFSLDTYILENLWKFNDKCSEIWTIPPVFLMVVHNQRKYQKSDSTTLATYFVNNILKDDFDFIVADKKGGKKALKLNADQSESLFFLFRAFVKYDINGCRNKIINTISGFFSEPEKLLISRG